MDKFMEFILRMAMFIALLYAASMMACLTILFLTAPIFSN